MHSLPTAYIALQGSRVRLEQGMLVIERADVAARTIPLGQIGAVVLLGAVECTTAALAELAARDIGCVIATRMGAVRAAVVGRHGHRGLRLRLAQLRLEALRAHGAFGAPCVPSQAPDQASESSCGHGDCAGESDRAPCTHPNADAYARAHGPAEANPVLDLARRTIDAKIGAMLGILMQHHRSHAEVDLAKSIAILRGLRQRLGRARSIDALRGFEGAASARYFAAFPALCRGELTTSTRTRRPPRDPINAALSFGYAVLAAEVHATVLARGLEPALGILHPAGRARPALALDLMEPLRHALIDRLVLRAVNRRELVAHDFEPYECAEEGRAASDGCADLAMVEVMEGAMDEPLELPTDLSLDLSSDLSTHHATPLSTHESVGESPAAAPPPGSAGLFDLLEVSGGPGQTRRVPAAVAGVRFTDHGRRKYLALLSELFEGSAHAPEGVTRPVRALLSDAVEAYETALLEALPGEAAPPSARSPEPCEVLS